MGLLPNIEVLELTLDDGNNLHDFSLLFMSKSLKKISILFEDSLSFRQYLPNLFEELAIRCPELTSFVLWCKGVQDFESFEQQLVQLLSGFMKLETVQLPLYGFSSNIILALSKLPRLRIVESEGPGFCKPIKRSSPDGSVLTPANFPSLTALEVHGPFGSLIRYFVKAPLSSRLISLNLRTTTLENSESLYTTLKEISYNCTTDHTHLPLFTIA